MDDKRFDELLGKAFEIEQNKQISREPSREELNEAAPFTDKQLEDVRRMCKKDKKLAWTKYVGKAAAVILCISLAGFGLMMTDPGIRATVQDGIAGLVDQYVNIDFSESGKTRGIDMTKTEIGYIPEGFELSEEVSEADKLSYVYTDGEERYLFIDVVESGEIFISYELDEHNVTYRNINGYDGYITYDELTEQGSVCWGNGNFTVVISGFTSREELIRIAEDITVTA